YSKEGKNISDFINKAPELLATAAFLIIIGIPVGYILNQIHHVWIWVIRVNWEEYFEMELEINKQIAKCKGREEELKDRYRYLLNRVHELGGLFVALFPTYIFLLSYHFYNRFELNFYIILYFIILFIVAIAIFLSRN